VVRIRLENITKEFGDFKALDGIDLEIEEGEFMALLGPSGSGKSTLLYIIAGIYKPTKGRIYFDDGDVTDLPPKDRNVGLVFQNWALYPHMSVFENITFPLELRKVAKGEIRRKVAEVTEMLKIENLLDRYPWQLSGGQQQRVAIARALVKEPDVLLLDEPLSNLDALLRIEVRAELKRLQKKLGITAVYVTHDQAEALAMADRIAVIKDGRLLQVGTPEEIYERPRHKFVGGFIGNPPMNFLNGFADRGILRIGKSTIPLPKEYESVRGEVIVGFRPHDVEIGEGIEGEVYSVEHLGREQIVTVSVEGEMVKVIVPGDRRFEFGDKVRLKPKKIVLFDKKTETAI